MKQNFRYKYKPGIKDSTGQEMIYDRILKKYIPARGVINTVRARVAR